MAPRVTIQSQKNLTVKLFQPAEIVPKWTPVRKKFDGETSSRFHIHSGVPQGSMLGPLLYVLYTSDLPTSKETKLGTFADDTAIFPTHEDIKIASLELQEHLHLVEKWLQKWKIKFNESRWSYVTFTLRKGHCPTVNINQTIIPQAEAVKYLVQQVLFTPTYAIFHKNMY